MQKDVILMINNLVFFGSFGAILLLAKPAFADDCAGEYTNVGAVR